VSAGVQRVGLYGGAFDPPHLAHVELARAFLAQAQLAVLHICPTAQAWHKQGTLTEAKHRLRMAELAFSGLPGLQIDAREIERGGPTYTLDTLRQLRQQYPLAELALLIGQDQLDSWSRWHGAPEIEQIATIYVASRGLQSSALPDERGSLGKPSYRRLQWRDMPLSATQIRQRVAQGQSIAGLVTHAVARYIDEHQLYRTNP
jgi:nicotinate-nucleotide adenylyltransferase